MKMFFKNIVHFVAKMVPACIIKTILWCFQMTTEVIYMPIILCRFFKTPKKCPPIKDELLLLSASEVAQRIRKKQMTSTAIVKAYIARITEVNPLINAVIENRFDKALMEAEKVDDFILKCDLTDEQIKDKYPLLGVPITIKGSVAVAGMLHTAGRVDCQMRAKKDAACVKYVRESGAIPLLVSNVPELCLNWETTNKLIGTTSNPYDLNRTPGGSSGGEASLICCGASLIGIGTDVAGSVRLPSHLCGIWGHKPSPHTVSTDGHYPDCKNKEEWGRIFMMGPMARYATDLRLLLGIMVEPDKKTILQLEKPVDVRRIKVYYMDDPGAFLAHKFNNNVSSAVEKVVAHFDLICDSKCTKVKIPLMKHCSELSAIPFLSLQGVDTIFDNKTHGEFCEFFRFFLGLSDHKLTTVGYYALNRYIPTLFSRQMNKILSSRQRLRDDFLKILGEDGVFVFPVSPREATFKGDVFRRVFDTSYLTIFNALGFPSTACPVTFSKNGLPIGIQVVGAPDLDRLTLAVAEEIERAFGGWRFNRL